MQRLLVATKNAHKTAEIAAILGPAWQIIDLTAFPAIPAPEETGVSFSENAILKAESASRLFDGIVLSDDSGLEVDALHGAPGVYSARYAGEGATDAANRSKLLASLAPFRHHAKPCSARFRCVIALAEKGRALATFDGMIEGHILEHESGKGGFGYDSLFVPVGLHQTFAELPPDSKNRLSHRARALIKSAEYLATHQ